MGSRDICKGSFAQGDEVFSIECSLATESSNFNPQSFCYIFTHSIPYDYLYVVTEGAVNVLRCIEVEKVAEMMIHVDHCVQLDKHSWPSHHFVAVLSLGDFEIQRAISSQLSIPEGVCTTQSKNLAPIFIWQSRWFGSCT